MLKPTDYNTKNTPTWCPGCGNFGTEQALKGAFAELGLKPENVVVVFDIGCSGNGNNWYGTNVFHGLHGRTLPAASGIKLANHNLTVVAIGGDGGTYGEGGNHLIHAARRNIDMTCIVADNQIYGLTTGQASPTSGLGQVTKTTPQGVIESPLRPMGLALAVSSGASFVARGFAGDVPHLKALIKEGIEHQGFAVIDVLQPCVTFNKINTYEYFRERVYKIEEEKGYNPEDKEQAMTKAFEWEEKIPIGVLYKKEMPTFASHFKALEKVPLARQSLDKISIDKVLQEFR